MMPVPRQLIPVAGLVVGGVLSLYHAGALEARWPATSVPTDPPRIEGDRRFEASGVVHVPGTDGVLFVDDARTREVFWMRLGADGTQRQPARSIALAADVTDLEGITFDGKYFYVVGSQSKRRGYDGDGLVRFQFDPASGQVAGVERISALKMWLADNVRELAGTGKKLGDEVLNIEAVAWDPVKRRLLLGLRAPIVDGQSLVIPLVFADPSAGFTRDNLRVDGGRALRLPLGGAGIRSLEFDARANAFRLITGAWPDRESLDFQLLEWTGGETPAAIRPLAVYSRKLKPEGIAAASLDGRQVSVIVFDVGRFVVTD